MIRLYSVQVVTRMNAISPPGQGGTTRPRPGSFLPMRLPPLLLLLLALRAVPGEAQIPVVARQGILSGVVRDSSTGEPVGYALVELAGGRQQVFASSSGRFRLSGVGAGRVGLRVRQIGYHPVTLDLRVAAETEAGAAPAELTVSMRRRALVLPELVALGGACPGMREAGALAPEGGTILEEAYQNAERILTLERAFPFVLHYQLGTTILDSSYVRIGGEIDTIRRDSRSLSAYRAGRVVERPGTRLERINAFTTSDIARAEFQRTHCFWYSGRDSVAGFTGFRIGFAPRPEVRTVDWAGSLLVDSASMSLLRTEARVVNLPRRGTEVLSVVCTIFYRPILPSLPQEHEARCVSTRRGPPRRIVVERWLLVNREFLGKDPGAPIPGEGR